MGCESEKETSVGGRSARRGEMVPRGLVERGRERSWCIPDGVPSDVGLWVERMVGLLIRPLLDTDASAQLCHPRSLGYLQERAPRVV